MSPYGVKTWESTMPDVSISSQARQHLVRGSQGNTYPNFCRLYTPDSEWFPPQLLIIKTLVASKFTSRCWFIWVGYLNIFQRNTQDVVESLTTKSRQNVSFFALICCQYLRVVKLTILLLHTESPTPLHLHLKLPIPPIFSHYYMSYCLHLANLNLAFQFHTPALCDRAFRQKA